MIHLFCLLLLALTTICLFPDTAVAQALRRWLIERPAAALSRFGLGRTIGLTALVLFGLFLFWVGEAEGMRLFAMMAPEALTWLALFDAGVMIDLIGLTLIAGGAGRIRPALDRARQILTRGLTALGAPPRRAARAVRIVVRCLASSLRKDADDRPVFGLQPALG